MKDTVFGKVKSVKEELVFINEQKQNLKLFSTEGDYGHNGFSSNEYTKNRFYTWWYKTPYVHYLNYFKEFNVDGQSLKEIWYFKNGDTVCEYEYKYNENRNLIQTKRNWNIESYSVVNKSYNYENKLKAQISFYSDDPEQFKYEYLIYDDSLRIKEINSYNNDGAISGIKNIYDDNGRIKIKVDKNYWVTNYLNNSILSYGMTDYATDKTKEEYFYDKRGNVIEIFHYSKSPKNENENELSGKTKNFYLKNDLIEYVVKTNSSDTINSIYKYKYDKEGRVIEEMITYPHYLKSEKHTIILNKKNVKLVGVYFPEIDFKIARVENYVYDEKNLIGLIYHEDNKKVECKFEYTFDDKNNWTEQVKYINGEKLYVWKRKINYYK
ncbi:hypothetical protein [Flavobacterium sp.]|uniref:hypothetical protein n=1 Tax=Flavobacterium sp. TaxID=239 RepID=UPI002A822F0F|nr:hypothetical protein [Flavobacterium sp.]